MPFINAILFILFVGVVAITVLMPFIHALVLFSARI